MRRTQFFFLASLLLNAGFLLGAQEYAVNWHAIPGGGGTSSGGPYSLSGSIGQSTAGVSMTGGNYALTGGFWSLISVVPTPGAPPLSISRAGGQLIVSWLTPAADWTLQQNSNLANAAGWAASGYPISTNNGVSRITISAPTGNCFFRLAPP